MRAGGFPPSSYCPAALRAAIADWLRSRSTATTMDAYSAALWVADASGGSQAA
jgi:hypothetical protein